MNEREVIFEVTQTNIDEGVLCSEGHCPIALALKDELDCWNVKVDMNGITLQDAISSGCSARLTPEIEDFVLRFDAEDEVEPEVFTITFRTGI